MYVHIYIYICIHSHRNTNHSELVPWEVERKHVAWSRVSKGPEAGSLKSSSSDGFVVFELVAAFWALGFRV